MKLKISPLVLLLGVLAAFTGRIQLFLSYLAAMILHESAHAECAKRSGYVLKSIKIMPYGAALNGEFGGMTSRDELKIAAIGPLCNIFFATVFTAIWWIVPETYFFTSDFVGANVFLAAFNLIPVYPLDGGRMFYALLKQKVDNVRKIMLIGNLTIAATFIAIFFFCSKNGFNVTFLTAAIFIAGSALIPEKRCRYEKLYDMAYRTEKIKRCLPVKVYAVLNDTPVKYLKNKLRGNYFSIFKITDGEGVVYEYDLDKLGEKEKNMTVKKLQLLKKSEKVQ